jgi:hypothetical protein
MTFICFMLVGCTDGIPVWLIGLAMLCDTAIIGALIFTGVIHA